jgi:tRNA threonylcarbamoyladenosine biosynthesis protein TsaE
MDALQTMESRSVEQTVYMAETLGSLLQPGSIITLEGDLGAGKTHFSQGIARGLGVQGIVNSPTFSLIKEYQGTKLTLYHMDLYRISLEEAEELGLEEYLFGEGVCIIEWADRIEDILPENRLLIEIGIRGSQERNIRVGARGPEYAALLSEWRLQLEKEPYQ